MKMTFRKILAGLLAVLMLASNIFAVPSAVTVTDTATEHENGSETTEEPVKETKEETAEEATKETAVLAASTGTCGDALTWTLDDEGTLTISGTGTMTNWSSSSSVPWYYSRSSIKSVVIGSGVETIGQYAFADCDSLESIEIPGSVKTMGAYVFQYCDSLESVTIGDGVTYISTCAFYGCISLEAIEIPDSVTSIGSCAFYDCTSLKSAAIGNSVKSIGSYAFYNCDSLESVEIPDSVTSIGSYAFYDCDNLEKVTMGDSVTSIGDNAFRNCDNLESVTIGESVTSIGDNAFYNCLNLKIYCYAETLGHTYVNNNNIPFVVIDSEIKSFATSMQAYLNLEDIISMGVGYKFSDMESINPEAYLEKVGLLVWSAASAPEEAQATYDNCTNIIEGAVYNSTLGRFETTTEGIVAKKLGDQLCFRTYCKNNDGSYSYSRLISNYSPKTYCYNQIKNNPDDETRIELMASILNYGAAAQKFFKYNTDNLMNSDLPEELK